MLSIASDSLFVFTWHDNKPKSDSESLQPSTLFRVNCRTCQSVTSFGDLQLHRDASPKQLAQLWALGALTKSSSQ